MRRGARSLVLAMGITLVLGVSPVGAYSANVWTNTDGFAFGCPTYSPTYPTQLYNLAMANFPRLGYSTSGVIGAGFTTSAFLGTVGSDSAVYVHSHGDNYTTYGSAFLQDPGTTRCNDYTQDVVRASVIKNVSHSYEYNVVIMSTCYLGASNSTMPGAFGISMNKTSTHAQFYMGYANAAYDSDEYSFESRVWSSVNQYPYYQTFAASFNWALAQGGYISGFSPAWFGNPDYYGSPGSW